MDQTGAREVHPRYGRSHSGLQLYGKDWKKIEALVGTRNGAQIRSHAQKFFIKVKKDLEQPEIQEHWEQTKESPPENSAPLSNFAAEAETRCEYSYFFNKMYLPPHAESRARPWRLRSTSGRI